MLCITLKNYVRACSAVSGGISDIAIFDPADFDFTQAADIDGAKQPYTAAALRAGATAATGGLMFLITFQQDEAEWQWKQSVKGCSTKYEHSFNFQLPDNSQTLTNFQAALDAASCCCGLGFIFRMNSGKIFVAGEKYVNGSSIQRFTLVQNGSTGGSGKLIDDPNVGNIIIAGNYIRNLNEFTGDWADIEALMVVVP